MMPAMLAVADAAAVAGHPNEIAVTGRELVPVGAALGQPVETHAGAGSRQLPGPVRVAFHATTSAGRQTLSRPNLRAGSGAGWRLGIRLATYQRQAPGV